jgi:hypothetical protein
MNPNIDSVRLRRIILPVLAAASLGSAAGAADNAARKISPAGDDIRAAAIAHGGNATDPAHMGIWKAVTPPNGMMHGEFANNDPVGLAAGVRIAADCSINWRDPDTGKLYCFATATSLNVFLDDPHGYLRQAAKYSHGATR